MEQKPYVLEQFADFVVKTKYEDIPPRVIEKVKLQIMTSLSAMRFSEWHPEGYKIYEVEEKRANQNRTATVFPLNKKLPPEEAAIVNSAYAMSLDFDDYMLLGHKSYSSVITPLAFLEEQGGTLKDLITTCTVTNEIMGRTALPCFFGPLNGQMTVFIHNIGAATAYGKVRGFDQKKMANAMALSLYEPNFAIIPGFYTEGCKLLTASIPVRGGIQAAQYAEQGVEGPLNMAEDRLGFFHFFSYSPVIEFTGDLGDVWLSDSLSYKRYPGTSYIAASVDSALGALHQLNLSKVEDIDQIKKIVVDTTVFSKTIESLSQMQTVKALDAIRINFSVRNSVAYALLRGDLIPSDFKQEEIDKYQDTLLKLREKIQVRLDLAMTIRILISFPQIIGLFKRMPKSERKKFMDHTHNINPKKAPFGERMANVIRFMRDPTFKQALKGLFKKEKGGFGLKRVDTVNYPMYQSARTKIIMADGRTETCDFPIPFGGSGTDFEERIAWVKKRVQMSFGTDPAPIFAMLDNPDTPISEFVKICSDRDGK